MYFQGLCYRNHELRKDSIKKPYTEQIHKRLNALEIEALRRLTEDLPSKSLEELETVYAELNSDAYSRSCANPYILPARFWLEYAKAQKLAELTDGIEQMDKESAEQLRTRIESMNYPERITEAAYARIYRRIYRLDMQQLINLCNDFDSLSTTDIQAMRLQIAQLSLLEKCKQMYLKRIAMREECIGLCAVSQYAQYAEGLSYASPSLFITTVRPAIMKKCRNSAVAVEFKENTRCRCLFYPERHT